MDSTMDLGVSKNVAPLLEEVKQFIKSEIAPVEGEYFAEIDVGDRWTFTERQTAIMDARWLGWPAGSGRRP